MTWKEAEKVNSNNRKEITEEATRDRGKFVRMHGSGKVVLLLGAVDGYDDFYWVTMHCDNLKVFLESCVGGYDVIEGDLPGEASILKWLQDNDAKGLTERINSQLKLEENESFLVDIRIK